MNFEQLLAEYEVDVECPDVNGMEHLQMLMRRSELATGVSHVTRTQHHRLIKADEALMRHAKQFYVAIQQIADLAAWRQNQHVEASQWWWYLDVISQLPVIFDDAMTLPRGEVFSSVAAERAA